MIEIYCDGGCKDNGNPNSIGSSSVLLLARENQTAPITRWRVLSNLIPQATNNTAELGAAILGLQTLQAPEDTVVGMYCDSKYVIQGITKYIYTWKKNGWRTVTANPVKNRSLWETLDALRVARKGKVSWHHVHGHSDNVGNNLVDFICKETMRQQIGYDYRNSKKENYTLEQIMDEVTTRVSSTLSF